ncbi:hypothetical protein M422DRAFT_51709 [Sphaerobolus stellatus SS14]|uniref:Uncharacterized protein n=1 Tax=Sphaerobolus stellatus (strain SS14) TaxID=990650 RepID=A0A0C9UJB2_SPHS4|nr:hypothetical protein M422DRAFT_51709 [Sphaerobolus stellatus SS14]
MALMLETRQVDELEDEEGDVEMSGEVSNQPIKNNEEYLSPARFPLSPSKRASKCPWLSPEIGDQVQSSRLSSLDGRAGQDSFQDVFGTPGQSTTPADRLNLFSSFSQSSDASPPLQAVPSPQAGQQPILHYEEEEEEDPPRFEAEKTFQLYAKYEYPNAGKISAKNSPTVFHEMDEKIPAAFPYLPFINKDEWSLAEFLVTSRLSKGSIDTFL